MRKTKSTVQGQMERPVLFKGEMVRAILDGRKTQTRRLVKPQPLDGDRITTAFGGFHVGRMRDSENAWREIRCPYGVAGDQLWVREAHAWADVIIDNVEREDAVCVAYRSDKTILRHEVNPPIKLDAYAINFEHKSLHWRPSIHIPRWASRITLEITNVRVERLQEISVEDCVAEGINYEAHKCGCEACSRSSTICPASSSSLIMEYATLWDSINGKGAWDKNPWVWVLEFNRVAP